MTTVETKRATDSGSLTAEQVEAYDREGYVILQDLLTKKELQPAQQAMEDKVEEIAQDLLASGKIVDIYRNESFDSRLARLFEGLSDEEFLKFGRGWRERRAGYYHLMANPKILDAVESLIGGEIFSNPVYNTRPKSYWPDANSNPVITVWIPFVDTNEENGCLHVWPRTHKSRLLSYHSETYSGTGYTEIDDEHLTRRQELPLPVTAGSAILFNDRCIHMSTPNRAKTVRWSVDLRYQPTDQDPMPQHGAGFLARSYEHPERVADLNDWLASRPEHEV
jgi:phytanoyl-CoA hydroxylase